MDEAKTVKQETLHEIVDRINEYVSAINQRVHDLNNFLLAPEPVVPNKVAEQLTPVSLEHKLRFISEEADYVAKQLSQILSRVS